MVGHFLPQGIHLIVRDLDRRHIRISRGLQFEFIGWALPILDILLRLVVLSLALMAHLTSSLLQPVS
jgi:hypothetical protein